MSDSEDDFMSDKFLVDTAPAAGPSTYTARRSANALKSLRAGQAKNLLTAKKQEEDRRREGLSKSLFDSPAEESGSVGGSGGNIGMGLMQKMGWKVGEGLGKKRSVSPEPPTKRARLDDEDDNDTPRGGIGSRAAPRTEPIRISLWSGRKGLSARSPSPPPLPNPSNRNPDALDPKKLARLGRETENFRTRQRREFGVKEVERKEAKAREMLVKFDEERGVRFHPLHVSPLEPLETLPKPLLKLIYPAQAVSPSSSRSPSPDLPLPLSVSDGKDKNLSAAEKLREQMRKDMLSELGEEEEDVVRFKIPVKDAEPEVKAEPSPVHKQDGHPEEAIDWPSVVSGTTRVLKMEPAEHLTYLISQLRNEHMFCFWCAYKYKSYEEMDGPGGCPGEDEDDH